MPVEVRVPSLGESINEVVVSNWLKKAGDSVAVDESVVEIESDKATVEVPAPAAGRIIQVLKAEGETAGIGDILAIIEEGVEQVQAAPPAAQTNGSPSPVAPVHSPVVPPAPVPAETPRIMPSAARIAGTAGIPPQQLPASGPGGRVLKEDALRAVEQQARLPLATAATAPSAPAKPAAQTAAVGPADGGGLEEIVPLSPIRKRIAERLVSSKQEMALLTTFNEIDMSNVMALRKLHQERFTEKYGVKLGFMSFFVKASIEALKLFPQVNAELRDNSIVYKNYYDIGIAVGGGKGLLVPVIRGADRLSFGELEQVIADFGARAQKNKIDLGELEGGTFTISNGGIYGSLMSTPIVNPPQSAILGLHAIQDRPVAREGQVVIRPMMYVALTYDHRIIDGRESVTFLRRIKDCLEDPARMLLEV